MSVYDYVGGFSIYGINGNKIDTLTIDTKDTNTGIVIAAPAKTKEEFEILEQTFPDWYY